MSADFNYHGPVVVFDLDDTLFRERDFCRAGFRHIAKRVHELTGRDTSSLLAAMEQALLRRTSHFNPLEKWLQEAGIYDRALIDDLIADYRRGGHAPLQPAAGARELLDRLRSRGVRLGIITDGRSITQRGKIRDLGLQDYFRPADISISEETGADKLSADPFRAFVRRYPEASGFTYVGDNPVKDFLHPNRLGWNTVMVRRNEDSVQPDPGPLPRENMAALTVASLHELLPILAFD